MKNRIINVEKVSYSYGKTLVLSDISFSLEEGDFLAIIGPNGSGKTTLVRLLLGLLDLQKGKIKILDQSIKKFSQFGTLGYVQQKATQFDKNFPASVKEIVEMGLLTMKKFPKIINTKDKKLIENILEEMGMRKFIDRKIGELSGGQQQKVFIAKALISKPKILFLDEPTSGVDQESQCKFYEMLKILNDKGITIVLISHDIGRVTKYVNKIASLNQKLSFYGSHSEFCVWDKKHKHKKDYYHKICSEL